MSLYHRIGRPLYYDCIYLKRHRLGALKWTDKEKLEFMRVCRACDYVYIGKVIPGDGQKRVEPYVKCMNPPSWPSETKYLDPVEIDNLELIRAIYPAPGIARDNNKPTPALHRRQKH